MLTIENQNLKVSLNELGAELTSVFDKATKLELLYQKDGAWPHQDVVLFPFIGPAKDYVINGLHYSCPTNHGFARTSVFSQISLNGDSAVLRFHSTDDTRFFYPFSFALTVTFALGKNGLKRSFLIENQGSDPLPCALGDHAAYKAHFGSAVLHLGDTPLTYLPRTSFLLHDPLPFGKSGDMLLLKEDFAKYETIVLLNPRHPISLSTGFGERITYHFHSPYLALWSPSVDSDFLCVEPWWGLAEYEGMPLEIKDRKAENLVVKSLLLEETVSYSEDEIAT
jgi:galactose mutarotase-like enzyme